jgi:hypothetical protein
MKQLCLFLKEGKSAASALQIRIQLPLPQLLIGISVRTLEYIATCFVAHSGRQILPYIVEDLIVMSLNGSYLLSCNTVNTARGN